MRVQSTAAVITAAFFSSALALSAAAQCPSVGSAPGCNEVITANPGGTYTVVGVPANGTNYDGSDDALVGFVNHSGSSISSLTLNGNGTDIFGFDGDGIDTYGITGNSKDPSGYGGPNAYFSGISPDNTMGTVDFLSAVPDGGSTYFSLEESFNAANPPTTTPSSVTPEPSSLVLLGSGVLGMAGMVRRRMLGQH